MITTERTTPLDEMDRTDLIEMVEGLRATSLELAEKNRKAIVARDEAQAELAAMKAGMIQRVGQRFVDGYGDLWTVVGRDDDAIDKWLLRGKDGQTLHFSDFGVWLSKSGAGSKFNLVGPAPDELADLKAALDLANVDLRTTDKQYRQLLRQVREENPVLDYEVRGALSLPIGEYSQHERPYAERELFEERMQEAVEKATRRNFVLRVRFCSFESIPAFAKGSVGVDREWTANLCLGSVKRELSAGVVGASYEVEIV